jgi:hypothetical protein
MKELSFSARLSCVWLILMCLIFQLGSNKPCLLEGDSLRAFSVERPVLSGLVHGLTAGIYRSKTVGSDCYKANEDAFGLSQTVFELNAKSLIYPNRIGIAIGVFLLSYMLTLLSFFHIKSVKYSRTIFRKSVKPK